MRPESSADTITLSTNTRFQTPATWQNTEKQLISLANPGRQFDPGFTYKAPGVQPCSRPFLSAADDSILFHIYR